MRLPGAKPTAASSQATADAATPEPSAELVAQRERLTEQFALMQSELGGLFYEMAIRDHVKLDVLTDKAAALQRVDLELAQVDHLLKDGEGAVGGHCPNCGLAHARGASYCSHCATSLAS